MEFKTSIFNYPLEVNGRYYLFNSYKLGIAEVGKDIYDLFANDAGRVDDLKIIARNEHGVWQGLLEGGFIVERQMDETSRVWYYYNAKRFASGHFSLTVVPTNKCNLSCSYCYQESHRDKMSKEVQKALYRFVVGNVEKKNGFSITWYGGEPLLAMDAISNLSRDFLNYSRKEGKIYRASLVTNGTLLTLKVIDRLVEHSINHVQITIDGPKHIHDERRPFKHGKASSFDSIMHGLDLIKGQIPVTVRINIDKHNLAHYHLLIEELEKRGLFDEGTGITVSLGYVRPWTDYISDYTAKCLDSKAFTKLQIAVKAGRFKGNKAKRLFPRLGGLCGAASRYSYVVDPLGNLLKCWIHINHKDMNDLIVGDVFNGVDLDNWNSIKWLSYDPLRRSEKCRNCRFLPLCLGGCPYQQLYKQDRLHETCDYWESRVKTLVKLYIEEEEKLD